MEALGSPPQVGAFAKLDCHKRTIQRVKKAVSGVKSAPASLASIVTENIISDKGRNFILYDSGSNDPERIIIFGDREHAKKLKVHVNWAGDGTFKATPKFFLQIFTLHFFYSCTIGGKVLNKAIPALFALLPNKYLRTYRRLWQFVRELIGDELFRPSSFIADFETAVRKSFLEVFPGATCCGCLFHLMQNILRRLKKLKFGSIYNQNGEVRKWVRYLGAIAFVPTANVRSCFDEISRLLGESGLLESTPALRELYKYFERNYLGSVDQFGIASNPRFPPVEWNQFDRVRNRLPRSDASLEGFHFGSQATLGVHPQFYTFAEKLKVK